MKNLGKILGIFVLLAVTVAIAAEIVNEDKDLTYHWRYKTTVNIETPEGIKTGSSVREVTMKLIYRPTEGKEFPYYIKKSVKGEAVVVDLDKRGQVYALLKGNAGGVDYAKDILNDVFPKPDNIERSPDYYSTLKDAKATLTVSQYPMLVMFENSKDPKTVKQILEYQNDGRLLPTYTIKADHFEELFGKGVKLKDITIEMTDEPVTSGIEKWLSWLPEYYNKLFDGLEIHTADSAMPLANSLASGAFSAGGHLNER